MQKKQSVSHERTQNARDSIFKPLVQNNPKIPRVLPQSQKLRIFVSSVQNELAAERHAIYDFVERDALLYRFFEVFLFENQSASGCRADAVYLAEVGYCDIYLALFGKDYGSEDHAGISPTEHEFNHATATGKERLVFVKQIEEHTRHSKMNDLLRKVENQIIWCSFGGISELTALVYASLVNFLEKRGIIQNRPFDEKLCRDAVLEDLDESAIKQFVREARDKRQFPLKIHTPATEILTHLGLLRDMRPTNAAILLFGRNPQQFIPCAEVRCMHFHGTEICRPVPFYRIFKGILTAQVDEATNFVLSVTHSGVGTRAAGSQAPTTHEIPPDVIREAIVNAIAHREYHSNAAVQVAVFADRIEVWNPGKLSPPLTLDSLRKPHRSIPRNQRICEPLFLAGYIEKYGTGTLMMIRESLAHGLPEPIFQQHNGEFAAIIEREWLSERIISTLHLNERQRQVVKHLRIAGRISNQEYQRLTQTTKKTATRDLGNMVSKGIVERSGTTGRGVFYALAQKRDIKKTMETFPQTHTEKHLKARQPQSRSQFSDPVEQVVYLLEHDEKSAAQLREAIGIKHRHTFRKNYLHPAMHAGLIEQTIPEKPRSRLQKYRITDKGRTWLAERSHD